MRTFKACVENPFGLGDIDWDGVAPPGPGEHSWRQRRCPDVGSGEGGVH